MLIFVSQYLIYYWWIFFVYSRFCITYVIRNRFLSFQSLSFHILGGVNCPTKVLDFYIVQCIFSFVTCTFVLYLKNHRLIQDLGDLRLCFCFCFFSVIVLALIFRSVVHFELLFLYGILYKGPTLFFCYCPSTICWKDNSCSIELSWYPCTELNLQPPPCGVIKWDKNTYCSNPLFFESDHWSSGRLVRNIDS